MVLFARQRSRVSLAAGTLITAIALVGCGSEPQPAAEAPSPTPRAEVTGTRLAVSYDGGVLVLDRDSLDVVADLPLEGFLRLNPAGDRRHLMVSTAEGFQVLDTGVEVQEHGDHAHYYGTDPVLSEVTFPAPEPGHVVVHDGHTALFSDGAGTAQVVASDEVAKGSPERTYTAASAHHGVAVPLPDEHLLVSLGTVDERVGALVVDGEGREVTRNEQCPGVHGEATAADGVAVLGCEDGVLVFDDGEFSKIDSPDRYGRIGNQSGSAESSVVLGDYKTDPDAELERPEQVSLIDTATKGLRLVDLGTSYSFRSLERGADGEALVLGTDGDIHVIDPRRAKVTDTIAVTRPWKEPLDWQQPRPTIHVDGMFAYVTEPKTRQLHIVDLDAGDVIDSVTLPQTPNELAGV